MIWLAEALIVIGIAVLLAALIIIVVTKIIDR
jgi:hypothetical protein